MCAWGSRRLVLATVFAAVAADACGREPTLPAAPQRGGQQVLKGLVYAENGALVVGAAVRVTGLVRLGNLPPTTSVGGCTGTLWFADSTITTSNDGTFIRIIGFGPTLSTMCVAVEIHPPAGSSLQDGLAWIPELTWFQRPDTARVVLLLTHR